MKMSNYNKNEDFDEDKINQISDELELENENREEDNNENDEIKEENVINSEIWWCLGLNRNCIDQIHL